MMPWYWLNEESEKSLARGYLLPGQTAKQRVKEICKHAESILKKEGFAKKLLDYASKGWVNFSSPVWANFGLQRGYPISCFGSYLEDCMDSILYTHAEVGMMSKYGGGTSGYFGDLRPRGSKITNNGHSSGPVHFLRMFDTLVEVVSQGRVRRGSFSPYLPIDSPDIMEFLDVGKEGNPIQVLNHAVCVSDEWLEEMVGGDQEKQTIWAKVLQRRGEMGYPYILFTGNANKGTVDVYKDKGHKILASNLCSEIMLPSNKDWSFVCCLSSVNLLHYQDWKDTDLIETMTYFLEAVMTDFIDRLELIRRDRPTTFYFLERSYNFAKENRALGLGVLGYHSLLQKQMLPFSSKEAKSLNIEIFKLISERSLSASKQMAKEYGEPDVLKGYGRRHTTTMSVAPTMSSSFILGQVSQSIEPFISNCYTRDLAKARAVVKNQVLEDILAKKGKDDGSVWNSIRDADGSVQHLDCLDEREKEIFLTFAEIDQNSIIEQAADRQKFIDQGQSLNLMISSDMSVKEVNALHLKAWRLGVKSLYYQHSFNAAQTLGRKLIKQKQ